MHKRKEPADQDLFSRFLQPDNKRSKLQQTLPHPQQIKDRPSGKSRRLPALFERLQHFLAVLGRLNILKDLQESSLLHRVKMWSGIHLHTRSPSSSLGPRLHRAGRPYGLRPRAVCTAADISP